MIAQPGGATIHTRSRPRCWGASPLYLGFARGADLVFLPHYTRHARRARRHRGSRDCAAASPTTAGTCAPPSSSAMQLARRGGGASSSSASRSTSFGLPGEHHRAARVAGHPGHRSSGCVGMQNTVNLLDGVDGLAAGVVADRRRDLAVGGRRPADRVGVVQLAAALAGTCAGFLIFNFHPARIFMGDSGAHFLGAALALISIVGVAKVAVAFALVVPVLALALPIGDTAWAIFRRRRRAPRSPCPTSSHLHHRLQSFRAGPAPDLLRLLRGKRPAGRAGPDAVRPRPHPGRRGGDVAGAGIDRGGGPASEDGMAGALALPSASPRRSIQTLGLVREWRAPRALGRPAVSLRALEWLSQPPLWSRCCWGSCSTARFAPALFFYLSGLRWASSRPSPWSIRGT